MTKKYCTFVGWGFFVACILTVGVERGYGDDLYNASLIGSLDSYDRKVAGKISIKDTGKVKLSIKGLKDYKKNKLISQNSTLVIETEVNDSSKTYSEIFLITDGDAELEFTLKDLNKDDKLEITSVTINKSTSTTPTPTVTASPTPAISPTAAPTATPTSIASPIPTSSSTPTSIVAQVFNASTTSGDTIMIPGGIISESTSAATPTPVTTPSPTATASPTAVASPTSSPEVIEAKKISIKDTINLKGHGKFKAFITLPSPYSGDDVREKTVVCEGAPVIDEEVDGTGRYIATFNIQDLDLESEIKIRRAAKDKKTETTTFTITGELNDGNTFQGSTKVKIKGKEKGKKDDEDNGKKKHD